VFVAPGVPALAMVDVGAGIAATVDSNAELVCEPAVESAEQAANAGTMMRRQVNADLSVSRLDQCVCDDVNPRTIGSNATSPATIPLSTCIRSTPSCWQDNSKSCSLTDRTIGCNTTAVSFNQLFDDRQSDS
jgi:hypothetical protein